jgi:hypothetical protein
MTATVIGEIAALLDGGDLVHGLRRAEELRYDPATRGATRRRLDRLIDEHLMEGRLDVLRHECVRKAEYAYRLMNRDLQGSDDEHWMVFDFAQTIAAAEHLILRTANGRPPPEIAAALSELARIVAGTREPRIQSALSRASLLLRDRLARNATETSL